MQFEGRNKFYRIGEELEFIEYIDRGYVHKDDQLTRRKLKNVEKFWFSSGNSNIHYVIFFSRNPEMHLSFNYEYGGNNAQKICPLTIQP